VERQLAELGWAEVTADDPASATILLFAEHGRALARTRLLDRVVLEALAPDLEMTADDVVCYPEPRAADSDGISGVALAAVDAGARLIVPRATPDGSQISIVSARDATFSPVPSVDADLTWFRVTGPLGPTQPAPSWSLALAAAHRAVAAELTGLAREILRLAVEHTTTRHQYGVPVSSFQAVRYRLAESHVAIVAAEGLVETAFVVGTPFAAAVAKAQAGRAHEATSAAAIQVCGAMGSSLEHPLHRYVARGLVLDAFLDGWADLVVQLGTQVHTSRSASELVEI
jgi:hypothetical protein